MTSPRFRLVSAFRLLPHARAALASAALALLAACSGQTVQRVDDVAEARVYEARARGDYQPPGPPDDPWGPYITEAAKRFDVPETWIRGVMHQESGGSLYHNGTLVTSWAGAMGLMQVMPSTYDGLRDRYSLGDDPYNPHDNILAGAAYMREMYDIYGSPGFLAAYNAGPRRLDDYLANLRPLPAETRNYVARIGPEIEGVYPATRSPAEQYAMNDIPTEIPAGLRYGGGGETYQVARATTGHRYARATERRYASAERTSRYARAGRHGRGHADTVEVAELPRGWKGRSSIEPRVYATAARVGHGGGWHLINSAQAAETLPLRRGSVQIAAFGTDRGGRGSHAAAGREHASAHGRSASCRTKTCSHKG
ncbi:transglycosylase SLT domain-containing protein [Acidisphaera rubrifaciens]|uniref:Murein transglycosylase n=1 Tax=Acidisphaera rubrifaciens HS-AP3 TaxID=1231350 RepID=A0A0D6P8B5_9PROT|nr:transglycosylase SLT domain-containing protein [Acidisphaera rubrifaciens]GAN77448.1 murein transglycosylase [Acidisphaera rubrifaciens HS-AP3]